MTLSEAVDAYVQKCKSGLKQQKVDVFEPANVAGQIGSWMGLTKAERKQQRSKLHKTFVEAWQRAGQSMPKTVASVSKVTPILKNQGKIVGGHVFGSESERKRFIQSLQLEIQRTERRLNELRTQLTHVGPVLRPADKKRAKGTGSSSAPYFDRPLKVSLPRQNYGDDT